MTEEEKDTHKFVLLMMGVLFFYFFSFSFVLSLLSALRVLRGSLLFKAFCDAHLRGYPNSRHGLVDKKWVSFSVFS